MPDDFTSMCNLKNKIKKNRKRLTDIETMLTVAGWEEAWGMDENDEGAKKYKFVVTKESWGCNVQYREYSQ